jgi:hypothetical protein
MTKKYEREIAEILERMERQGHEPAPRRPKRAWRLPPSLQTALSTPTQRAAVIWLGICLGLPLVGALISGMAPGLASLLVVVGISLFVTPLLLRLVGYLRKDRPRLWRGRVVDMPYRGTSAGMRWRYQIWQLRQKWERWLGRR